MAPLIGDHSRQKYAMISSMGDLTLKVLKRAKAAGAGSALTPKAFADLGNRAAVDQALSRLTKAGKIRRISRGVYDIPKTHPTLGPLSPDPDAVAQGYRGSVRLSPATDAGASSEHARSLFASSRADRISDRRQLAKDQSRKPDHPFQARRLQGLCWGLGTPAGVALQAIRAFGPDHLTDGVLRQLRHNLPSDAKTGLKKLALSCATVDGLLQ